MRALYRHYYQSAAGLIYILDIASRDSWITHGQTDELTRLLSEPQLIGLPLLILGNKADLPTAMSQEEVEEYLDFTSIRKTREVMVRRISALAHKKDTAPINDSFDWLKQHIRSSRKPLL
jgi:ADP-ribosylation factor-like protein 8